MVASTQEFRILVADDSRLYRKLVEETLAQEQYMVWFAKNGRAASDLLAEHRPALVITDWEMPDITGIELCGQIRSDKASYTYIILLTSNTDKDQIIRGLAAGADDYLTKPFHSGELLARVAVGRRIIELHREIQAKNGLLEELALTDALTGLPNRRAIEDWAVRQLSGAGRHGFLFWLVMADLDSFKSVNDTYGHEAGDVVIKKFADLLKANTRASNICGRIGGEEFVVVITHVEKPNIQIVVDRIRQQFEAEKFTFGGCTLGVTASFGISGFQGGEAPKFSQLLREADAALYAAKRAGRNRIEFATKGLC
jgi:diguanylate cyclase (GGDEF)-like protein